MIFDSFIENTSFSNSVVVEHYRVTEIGYDEHNHPDWDNSVKVMSEFKAMDSEIPQKVFDYKRKDIGDITTDDRILVVPSHIEFNGFAHKGVRDRVIIDGSTYQIDVVEDDIFMDQKYVQITVSQMVGEGT